MRTGTSRGTFEDVIRASQPEMADFARALRDLIAEVFPEPTEIPRPAEQHAGYGVGLNQRTEIFANLCPMPNYVRLVSYNHFGEAIRQPIPSG